MKTIVSLLCLFLTNLSFGQHDFVTQCEGVWIGTMDIYAQGELRPDGPEVTFTVAPIVKDSVWTWRTDYISKEYGVISKDYELKTKNSDKGHYLLDEGDGIVLDYQLSGNKMYCVFEVQDFVLGATYELRQNQLIFEVYSSPRSKDSTEVLSHTVRNVQRVALSRKQ